MIDHSTIDAIYSGCSRLVGAREVVIEAITEQRGERGMFLGWLVTFHNGDGGDRDDRAAFFTFKGIQTEGLPEWAMLMQSKRC
jgi:hypothetical protein